MGSRQIRKSSAKTITEKGYAIVLADGRYVHLNYLDSSWPSITSKITLFKDGQFVREKLKDAIHRLAQKSREKISRYEEELSATREERIATYTKSYTQRNYPIPKDWDDAYFTKEFKQSDKWARIGIAQALLINDVSKMTLRYITVTEDTVRTVQALTLEDNL